MLSTLYDYFRFGWLIGLVFFLFLSRKKNPAWNNDNDDYTVKDGGGGDVVKEDIIAPLII